MSRRKTQDSPSDHEPSFEQALAELDTLVSAMEESQLPLETLVSHYEKGSRLLARCESILHSARQRLHTIAESANAGNSSQSTDSLDESHSITDDAPAKPAAFDDDDDIRLF